MKTKIFLTLLSLLLVNQMMAQSRVNLHAGTVTVWSLSGSSSGWSNTTNASASDDVYITPTSNMTQVGDFTDYICFYNLGANVPVGATIQGITVIVERKDDNAKAKDAQVKLIKSAIAGGTDHSSISTWATTDAANIYGSDTDLWGRTWTVNEINSSTFGVVLSIQRGVSGGGQVQAKIDEVVISVYYVPAALPVVMNDFSGEQRGNKINLEWSTAQERGIESFRIKHRATDGNMMLAGEVNAMGDSLSNAEYDFNFTPGEQGNYEFKLYSVSLDGTEAYLGMDEVFFEAYSDFTLNVNYEIGSGRPPVAVLKSERDAHGSLCVIGSNGAEEMEIEITIQQGENEYELNGMQNATDGVYFVIANVEGTSLKKKFLYIK